MKKTETGIKDLWVIEPDVYGDGRGWFMESWSEVKFAEMGIFCRFVQDNQSYSAKKGTMRGLHFQKGEFSQAKLVRCIRGVVYDVAVDLRKSSPTFLKWFGVKLSAENKKQLFIPRGFAHGFLTLTDDVEFAYKVDNVYVPSSEGFLRYNDSKIGINWEQAIDFEGVFTVSERDLSAPLFDEAGEDILFE